MSVLSLTLPGLTLTLSGPALAGLLLVGCWVGELVVQAWAAWADEEPE